VVSGLREAELNMRVARLLRPLLVRAGVEVVMTRTTTSGTSMGNIARARIANRAGAALFLRIHADGSTDRAVRGTHTLHPALRRGWTDDVYAESRRAARVVQGRLRAALGFPDRGLQERSDFTGFNWADVPVILVEMGFMSNPTEDRLLATRAYQRRAAVGLCRGTLLYLRRSPAACG
jgi:N-acetylmuramoyl-L-alanine amidase